MKINEAEFKDLQTILELQKLCYEENAERYNDFNIPPMVQTLEQIQDEFDVNVILKAEDESKIVGSVRAYENDDVCYIGRLIVHPDSQNKGVGAKLMAAIESKFPTVSKYELFTGYKDKKNLYFYGKLGYIFFREENMGDNVRLVLLEKRPLKDY